ncbi:MAG: hypothetical protein EPO32_07610 [Anaerolineae bacterium]|nr:MAG: hypothetical protein EPO32_07610 [Anaerolineae bacterium]
MSATVILAFVLGPLLLAGVVVWMVLRNMRRAESQGAAQKAELDERKTRAAWAGATVASLRNRPTPAPGERVVRVDLRLEVRAQDGTRYFTTPSWMVNVEALANLQPGTQVSVKIDANDPQLIFPNVSWAELWPGTRPKAKV